MARYRSALPQLSKQLFLTDGGLETTLIFLNGLHLPEFAAFDLLKHDEGHNAIRDYFRTYARLAQDHAVGIILESATWRANPRWAAKIGYSSKELADFNRKAIALLAEIRSEFETEQAPVVISGCIGPAGDGYVPGDIMSVAEAERYHAEQIGTFTETQADMVTAITMCYVEEAIGVVRAAREHDIPSAISFTVETDGKLPTGQTLREAIQEVDEATDGATSYFMINCAHPSHFADVIEAGAGWTDRIRGLRANASTLSHAELDEAENLDDGDPVDLARRYVALKGKLKNLNVMGGCCGTDHRHIEEIYQACATLF